MKTKHHPALIESEITKNLKDEFKENPTIKKLQERYKSVGASHILVINKKAKIVTFNF